MIDLGVTDKTLSLYMGAVEYISPWYIEINDATNNIICRWQQYCY